MMARSSSTPDRSSRGRRAHVPGALSIPLRPQFGHGWDGSSATIAPLVFVLDARTRTRRSVVRQALTIGYEQLLGVVDRRMPRPWRAAGLPIVAIELVARHDSTVPSSMFASTANHQAGHIPGAILIELGDIAAKRGDSSGGRGGDVRARRTGQHGRQPAGTPRPHRRGRRDRWTRRLGRRRAGRLSTRDMTSSRSPSAWVCDRTSLSSASSSVSTRSSAG